MAKKLTNSKKLENKSDNKTRNSKKPLIKALKKSTFTRYGVLLVFLILLGALLYLSKSIFVAALVGGRPISRLELVKELEKQSGKQTLESLITKKLIFSEAQKEGINISNVDVESEIEKIAKQIEAQGSTLDAALSVQGQTRKDLEENIRIQKTVEKLLREDININEEDIKKYYEDNKSFYPEESKFEDLKEDIKTQLANEKLSTAFKDWMDKLRSESNIIYFVNF